MVSLCIKSSSSSMCYLKKACGCGEKIIGQKTSCEDCSGDGINKISQRETLAAFVAIQL